MGNQWKLIGADREHTIFTNAVLCSNNGEVLREAAIKGLGIALLPTFIVGSCLRRGILQAILPDYHPQEIYVCIIYPAHRHLSTKIQLFTPFLKARFSEESGWKTDSSVFQGEITRCAIFCHKVRSCSRSARYLRINFGHS